MSSETAAAPGDPLETIKHVTAVEAELEAKLAQLRTRLKSQLESIQQETEALVLRARAEAERARETALAAARSEADQEAERIVAEGATRAGAIRGKSAADLARQKEALLSATLAEFRSPEKRPPA